MRCHPVCHLSLHGCGGGGGGQVIQLTDVLHSGALLQVALNLHEALHAAAQNNFGRAIEHVNAVAVGATVADGAGALGEAAGALPLADGEVASLLVAAAGL